MAALTPSLSAERTEIAWGRWGTVFGALVIQMILGTVYAFSVFVEPFEEAFGWTRTQITITASISLAMFALTMIFAGILQDERGPRFTALTSAVLLGSAFVAVSQMANLVGIYAVHGLVTAGLIVLGISVVRLFEGETPTRFGESVRLGIVGGVSVASLLVAQGFITGGTNDSLWMLYLTYGVLGGAGIGMGYVSPIAASVKWFPSHRGLITGVAVAGFGAGSLIFAPSARWTIERVGWSTFFLIHGFVCAIGLLIGGLLLRNPPPHYEAPRREEVSSSPKRTSPSVHLPWEEMVRTGTFWRLWFLFVMSATAGLMAITQLKPFATLRGLSDQEGALAISTLAAFNAVGRIGWGAISDRLGRGRTMSLMFFLQAVMMILVNVWEGKEGFYVAAAWIGFHFGGIFALFPSAIADAFGTKNVGTNYGFLFTAYGVGGIVGPVVGARVYDATGEYTTAFLLAGAGCFLASLLAGKDEWRSFVLNIRLRVQK